MRFALLAVLSIPSFALSSLACEESFLSNLYKETSPLGVRPWLKLQHYGVHTRSGVEAVTYIVEPKTAFFKTRGDDGILDYTRVPPLDRPIESFKVNYPIANLPTAKEKILSELADTLDSNPKLGAYFSDMEPYLNLMTIPADKRISFFVPSGKVEALGSLSYKALQETTARLMAKGYVLLVNASPVAQALKDGLEERLRPRFITLGDAPAVHADVSIRNWWFRHAVFASSGTTIGPANGAPVTFPYYAYDSGFYISNNDERLILVSGKLLALQAPYVLKINAESQRLDLDPIDQMSLAGLALVSEYLRCLDIVFPKDVEKDSVYSLALNKATDDPMIFMMIQEILLDSMSDVRFNLPTAETP